MNSFSSECLYFAKSSKYQNPSSWIPSFTLKRRTPTVLNTKLCVQGSVAKIFGVALVVLYKTNLLGQILNHAFGLMITQWNIISARQHETEMGVWSSTNTWDKSLLAIKPILVVSKYGKRQDSAQQRLQLFLFQEMVENCSGYVYITDYVTA